MPCITFLLRLLIPFSILDRSPTTPTIHRPAYDFYTCLTLSLLYLALLFSSATFTVVSFLVSSIPVFYLYRLVCLCLYHLRLRLCPFLHLLVYIYRTPSIRSVDVSIHINQIDEFRDFQTPIDV